MLDHLDEALAARNYKKYQGAHWTLIFLADMQADGRDKRVRKLAEHVLSTQLANGGFSASGEPRHGIVCLTANILRSLGHLGYGEDERVIGGYRRLIERIVPHGGVPCVVLDYVMHTACKMTLPQTLRCLAVAPPGVPNRKLKQARDLITDQLLAIRVYRYVRPDAKAYYAALDKRPDILTSAGSFLTILGPRFDVEAEGERGFGDRQVAGVQLLAQGHQGRGVARGTELAEMDIEPAVG